MIRRDSRLTLILDVWHAATALRLAKVCGPSVDAVEDGWPLVLSAGPQIVFRLAAEEDVPCDFKIADIPPAAGTITAPACARGAKGVICQGFAGDVVGDLLILSPGAGAQGTSLKALVVYAKVRMVGATIPNDPLHPTARYGGRLHRAPVEPRHPPQQGSLEADWRCYSK